MDLLNVFTNSSIFFFPNSESMNEKPDSNLS